MIRGQVGREGSKQRHQRHLHPSWTPMAGSMPPPPIISSYREIWTVRFAQTSYPVIFLSALGAYLKPSLEWPCSGEKTGFRLSLIPSHPFEVWATEVQVPKTRLQGFVLVLT